MSSPCMICRGGTPGGNMTQVSDEHGNIIRGRYLCAQCAAMPPDQWQRPEPDCLWRTVWQCSILGAEIAWLTLLNLLPFPRTTIAKMRRMMDRG